MTKQIMKRNSRNGSVALSMVKAVIFMAVLLVLMVICIIRISGDHAVGTYINDNQLVGYNKESTALKQTTLLSFSDTCTISFDSNKLRGISVSLYGQTSEKYLYASTEAVNVASAIGLAEITVGDDGSFTFDANYSFENGETVLMKVEYNGSDSDFGSDITTKYFAFCVTESSRSAISSTATSYSTYDTGDVNTDMTPSVYFNGSTVATYDSKTIAISNAERTYVSSYDIMVEPNGVDRVIISTYIYNTEDGTFSFNNDETIIYSGTDWFAHLDFSQFVNQVVVIKVRTETTSTTIETENRFIALQIRENESAAIEP